MQKIRRILFLTLVLVIRITGIETMAYDRLLITMNDVLLGFDSPPYIDEGRTMVPIRTLTEAIGAEVAWDSESEIITINHETDTLYLKIGVYAYTINGNSYVMETAPSIVDGRTMVPLRFVAETFGCEVAWNEEERTVVITKEGVTVPDHVKASMAYTEEDLLWLARIVHVEGLDIGYEAKLAIANVVLNRVKSDIYPNTVYEVIKDTHYATQFPPAHRSSFDTLEPGDQSYEAALDALSGINNIEECLYFNNAPFKWKTDDLYKVIDGEYFYK